MKSFFYLIFFCFCLLIPTLFSAQVKNNLNKWSYEDLKLLYNNSKNNSDKLNFAVLYVKKGKLEGKNIRIAKGYYLLAMLQYDIDNVKTIQLLDSVIKYSIDNHEDNYFPAAAFCDKAIFLEKKHLYTEAIKNYKIAESYALKNNLSYYYVIRSNIANAKSEKLGETEEALQLFKECYDYYNSKNVRNKIYSHDYQYTLFGLADGYKSLKKTDSCSFFNRLGCTETKATNNEFYYYMFVLNEGANQILKKNYKVAIDSINRALPKLKELKNQENVLASYFYYGKAYEGLGKKELALKNYVKVDSIYQINNEILTPEFIDGYQYIINYYKEKGDQENQLKYLKTYLNINNTLQKNYKYLNKSLQKDYDIPHLINDKEALIISLKNKTQYYYLGIVTLLLAIIGLLYYQKHTKKIYKQRFEKIIAEIHKKNRNSSKQEVDINVQTIKELNIAKEIVEKIIEQLHLFEHQKGFLNPKISIQTLADELDTNTKYLSRIVNKYKRKTFVNYINDLRIDYAIKHLQNDNRARKYTLQALALEYGFNTAESFSTAFNKKTGLKPSYFIKEIETKKT